MKNNHSSEKIRRTFLRAMLLLTMLCTGTSCNTDDTENGSRQLLEITKRGWVKLDKTLYRMEQGNSCPIVPEFSDQDIAQATFVWTSSNPAVASITPLPDQSAEIKALALGTTIIEISCEQNDALRAQCVVTVKPATPKTIRILAIGNSFSEDAVEQYLWELADAEGIDLIVGNMYIGGCSLEMHVENATGNKPAYAYRKVVKGSKTSTSATSLATALADEPWDYISLQQVSGLSGIYSTFEASLPALADYVRARATNKEMKLLLHQTWAYAASSAHADFVKYDKDQMNMYRAIVSAYDQAARLIGAHAVIPSGTAIQNARTSYLGDTFCRDGYHLERTYGRYTAACTWFEKIFERDVTRNDYKPETVSDHLAEIARTAAHLAVLTPGAVTELTDYKIDPDLEGAPYGYYVDFGSTASPAPWNSISSYNQLDPMQLTDSEGKTSGVTLRLSNAFGGPNDRGPQETTTDLEMPSTVSSDSFWGNTGAAFQQKVTGPIELIVEGLDPQKTYVCTFFASRGQHADNLSTQFTVTGQSSEVLLTNAANNTTHAPVSKPVAPKADGSIVVTLTSGPENNNTNGFFYINAMRIAPVR